MNDGLIVLAVCLIFVLGAALPLLKTRSEDKTPLPSPKETLHDWRSQQQD